MKLLDKETNFSLPLLECSAQLVELVPVIMSRIRGEIRSRTMPGLSMQQFRTLNYLRRHPRSSLSNLAHYLGLSLPSTSKLVQQLVEKQVITRRSASDRRRISLSLTQIGIEAFNTADLETQQQIAEKLSSLSNAELSTLSKILEILRISFVGGSSGVGLP